MKSNFPMKQILETARLAALERLFEADYSKFNTVFVNYEKPFVERMWFQLDEEHRVFLHHILPCESNQALWHSHPWPSIVQVLDAGGGYEHGIGVQGNHVLQSLNIAPSVSMLQYMEPGSVFSYEMPCQDAWHYVSVKERGSWSLMVTGRPFNNASPRPPLPKMGPLDPETVKFNAAVFKNLLRK